MWCRRHDRSPPEEPLAASAWPIDKVNALVGRTAGALSQQFPLISTWKRSAEVVSRPDGS